MTLPSRVERTGVDEASGGGDEGAASGACRWAGERAPRAEETADATRRRPRFTAPPIRIGPARRRTMKPGAQGVPGEVGPVRQRRCTGSPVTRTGEHRRQSQRAQAQQRLPQKSRRPASGECGTRAATEVRGRYNVSMMTCADRSRRSRRKEGTDPKGRRQVDHVVVRGGRPSTRSRVGNGVRQTSRLVRQGRTAPDPRLRRGLRQGPRPAALNAGPSSLCSACYFADKSPAIDAEDPAIASVGIAIGFES